MPRDSKRPTHKTALVLTGGGARAAYQAGVLRALAVITGFEENPFRIISGLSAGAINGTWLASRTENFNEATKIMWKAWADVKPDDVFNTNSLSLMRIAFRWVKDRGLGGLQQHSISYLLDTAPLEKFIRTQINFDNLNKNIQSRKLHGVSVTAVNYRTGYSTVFYNGSPEIQDWKKFNRFSVRSEIRPEYVMASAAIPIFFPPVRIGDSFYGDGMVRLNAPLSSAIHMGAEKILVIGLRGPRVSVKSDVPVSDSIAVSEIAGTILSGLFFDALDADLDRMERVNRTLSVMNTDELLQQPDHLRSIPMLHFRPTKDCASRPMNEMARLPTTLNYLLRGIGVSNDKGKDLLSYLSFEPRYTRCLLELGYEDTFRKQDEIRAFFRGETLTESPVMSQTL